MSANPFIHPNIQVRDPHSIPYYKRIWNSEVNTSLNAKYVWKSLIS